MAAVVIDIVDAIVAALDAVKATLAIPFEVAKRSLPNYELPELETAVLSVIPATVAITHATRGMSYWDYRIDVAVQKRLDATDRQTQIDTLVLLSQEVADELIRVSFATTPASSFLRCEIDPLWVEDHLSEKRLFTSVVRLHYRVGR